MYLKFYIANYFNSNFNLKIRNKFNYEMRKNQFNYEIKTCNYIKNLSKKIQIWHLCHYLIKITLKFYFLKFKICLHLCDDIICSKLIWLLDGYRIGLWPKVWRVKFISMTLTYMPIQLKWIYTNVSYNIIVESKLSL